MDSRLWSHFPLSFPHYLSRSVIGVIVDSGDGPQRIDRLHEAIQGIEAVLGLVIARAGGAHQVVVQVMSELVCLPGSAQAAQQAPEFVIDILLSVDGRTGAALDLNAGAIALGIQGVVHTLAQPIGDADHTACVVVPVFDPVAIAHADLGDVPCIAVGVADHSRTRTAAGNPEEAMLLRSAARSVPSPCAWNHRPRPASSSRAGAACELAQQPLSQPG